MCPDGEGGLGRGGGCGRALRRAEGQKTCAGAGRDGEQRRRRAGGGQASVGTGLSGGGLVRGGQGEGFQAVEAAEGNSGALSGGTYGQTRAAGVCGAGGRPVRRGPVQERGGRFRGGCPGLSEPGGVEGGGRHAQRNRHGYGGGSGPCRGGGHDGDFRVLQERARAVSRLRICGGSPGGGHRHRGEELFRRETGDVRL